MDSMEKEQHNFRNSSHKKKLFPTVIYLNLIFINVIPQNIDVICLEL